MMPGKPTYEELENRVRKLEESRKAAVSVEALTESRRVLQSILDSVPDLLIVIDREHRIKFTNAKGHDSIVQTDAEKQGTCYSRFKLLDKPCEDCTALPVFETGCIVEREMVNPADGRVREVRAFPIFDSSGRVDLVCEHVRDISDRKRSEEELKAAEQEKGAILSSLMEHVIHQDKDMKIVWANRAACESVGKRQEEIIGCCCYEIWQGREDPCPDCPVKLAMETGKPQEVEKDSPDGRSWLIRGYPVRDAQNGIVGGIEVLLEITERRNAENALNEAYKILNVSPATAFLWRNETGTGLGLSTVYGIVKQNNGFINVYSEPDAGTSFKVYFPRYHARMNAEMEKQDSDPIEGGSETVLIVEDDESILDISRELLGNFGYNVLSARKPIQALHLAGEHTGEIHLLITDVVMPEMNGKELAERLLVARPLLKCLYMSGYTSNVITHHGILDEGVSFISKPFSINDLAAKVREVLDAE